MEKKKENMENENTEKKKEDMENVEKEEKVKGTVTVEETKKSNISVCIGIAVAIIVVIAIILGIAIFTKSPKYAVMKAFNALKSGDIGVVNSYVSYEDLMDSLVDGLEIGEERTDLEKNCFSQFTYKIKSSKVENDTATVSVEITNKNFRNALTKWTQAIYQRFINGEEISNEQGINILNEYLADESIGTISSNEDITLNKVDGKWQIKIDESLRNAVFPGLDEVVNSIEALLGD